MIVKLIINYIVTRNVRQFIHIISIINFFGVFYIFRRLGSWLRFSGGLWFLLYVFL